jgi:hypothetical protein
MFDEKLYSLTVINAEESIRRAETADQPIRARATNV